MNRVGNFDFRIDPNIPEAPEDQGKAMMHRIREAQRSQAYEDGRRAGYDEGFAAGVLQGRKEEQEDFFDYFYGRYKGDR